MNLFKKLFSGSKEKPVDLPPEFHQASPPDWLIELKGAELPHGNHFSIRVQLVNASRTGTAEILKLPCDETEQPKSAAAELSGPNLDRLLVILGFSFPEDIANVPADVMDGLPVTISIHRAEPYSMKAATCNLAGWTDSKKSRPPVVEIGTILLEVCRQTLGADGDRT